MGSNEWACGQCTFLNSADAASCSICEFEVQQAPVVDNKRKRVEGQAIGAKEMLGRLIVLDDDESPEKPEAQTRDGEDNIASTSLLHQLHLERLARQQKGTSTSQKADSSSDGNRVKSSGGGSRERAGSSTFGRPDLETEPKQAALVRSSTGGQAGSSQSHGELVVLSYNVWFNESVQLQRRMAAIGDIIERHSPHVIFFQEITANIYSIFRRSSWWARLGYKCSLEPAQINRQYFAIMVTRLPVSRFRHEPFQNSVMGRDLVTAKVNPAGSLELTLATTHLESPTGRDQLFSEPRVAQARVALGKLSAEHNVIFGGDMNWNDDRDGPVPLPDGWIDPWLELHKTQPGYTYDSVLNQMLTGNLKGRVDRFFCRLADFSLTSIEMVGKEPIPGLTYERPGWGRYAKPKTLPVLPSDHFGLLLKLARKGR